MRYGIGVASRDHARRGVAGGFCHIDHGKAWALKKMQAGDRLIYYSPRTQKKDGDLVQSFTAIGEVQPGEPYPFDMGGGFVPFRKNVKFAEAEEATIKPLRWAWLGDAVGQQRKSARSGGIDRAPEARALRHVGAALDKRREGLAARF